MVVEFFWAASLKSSLQRTSSSVTGVCGTWLGARFHEFERRTGHDHWRANAAVTCSSLTQPRFTSGWAGFFRTQVTQDADTIQLPQVQVNDDDVILDLGCCASSLFAIRHNVHE